MDENLQIDLNVDAVTALTNAVGGLEGSLNGLQSSVDAAADAVDGMEGELRKAASETDKAEREVEAFSRAANTASRNTDTLGQKLRGGASGMARMAAATAGAMLSVEALKKGMQLAQRGLTFLIESNDQASGAFEELKNNVAESTERFLENSGAGETLATVISAASEIVDGLSERFNDNSGELGQNETRFRGLSSFISGTFFAVMRGMVSLVSVGLEVFMGIRLGILAVTTVIRTAAIAAFGGLGIVVGKLAELIMVGLVSAFDFLTDKVLSIGRVLVRFGVLSEDTFEGIERGANGFADEIRNTQTAVSEFTSMVENFTSDGIQQELANFTVEGTALTDTLEAGRASLNAISEVIDEVEGRFNAGEIAIRSYSSAVRGATEETEKLVEASGKPGKKDMIPSMASSTMIEAPNTKINQPLFDSLNEASEAIDEFARQNEQKMIEAGAGMAAMFGESLGSMDFSKFLQNSVKFIGNFITSQGMAAIAQAGIIKFADPLLGGLPNPARSAFLYKAGFAAVAAGSIISGASAAIGGAGGGGGGRTGGGGRASAGASNPRFDLPRDLSINRDRMSGSGGTVINNNFNNLVGDERSAARAVARAEQARVRNGI